MPRYWRIASAEIESRLYHSYDGCLFFSASFDAIQRVFSGSLASESPNSEVFSVVRHDARALRRSHLKAD